MNKKQMIILWILGIWISWAVIATVEMRYGNLCGWTVPYLIIGGLLIYTLRTRK